TLSIKINIDDLSLCLLNS
ncbi:unnamed protein product, partial [Onchocerca ochengi]|uniref:Uncharacterized protein n=1 Tax=Onchocerca ochengi TaxID=42157 RepID=A0A182EW71_ONCOC